MHRLIPFFLWVGILPTGTYSQVWQQVYPGFGTDHIGSIVHWHGDTVFAAGTKWTLLRSIDAGRTWERMFQGDAGWDIVRMGTDGNALYLFPAPTRATWDEAYHDNKNHFFFKYDVHTGDTSRIFFPIALQVGKDWLYFDMDVSPDCITILENYQRFALVQSTDQGKSWSSTILPDSLNTPGLAFHGTIFFRDKNRGILISHRNKYNATIAHVTSDGGRTWRSVPAIQYPRTVYLNRFPKYPGMWVDDTTVILVSDGNTPCVSTNAGLTWSFRPWLNTAIWSIHLLPSGRGYAVGQMYDVHMTADSWRNSVTVRNSISYDRNNPVGLIMNGSTFIASGMWGIAITTTDYGISWNDDRVPEYTLSNIEFFTQSDGASTIKDGYDYGKVYYGRTVDGGKTWEKRSELSGNISRVKNYSSDVVFGYPLNDADKGVLISRSRDGGYTWTPVYTVPPGEVWRVLALFGVYKSQNESAFFVPTNKGLLLTTDAGQTWSLKPTLAPSIIDCRFRNSIWGVMKDGIYKSSNDGDTWTKMLSLPDSAHEISNFNFIHAISQDTAIANLFFRSNGPLGYYWTLLFLTTDGGLSWEMKKQNEQFQKLVAFPSGVGYWFAGGFSTFFDIRQLFFNKTSDFWTSQNRIYDYRDPPSMTTTPELVFLDELNGWIFAQQTLFRTTNGGISWTELPLPGSRSVTLEPSYPNPVSTRAVTTIPFTVTNTQEVHVRIEIHDLLGRKVATVYDSPTQQGKHTAQWNTQGVTPGMYFVRLSGAETKVRKVVVR